MVRSSAAEDAARLMAMYISDFPTGKLALQFDVRLADGGVATELASTVQDVDLPVRVALTRRGDLWTVSYSPRRGGVDRSLGWRRRHRGGVHVRAGDGGNWRWRPTSQPR